jgi:hypothetical protein
MDFNTISFLMIGFKPVSITSYWLSNYIIYEFVLNDPGFMSVRGSKKASKTISSPCKPEGNATHRVHRTFSPEIVLMGGYNTHVFAT